MSIAEAGIVWSAGSRLPNFREILNPIYSSEERVVLDGISENGHVSHGKAEKPEREIVCVVYSTAHDAPGRVSLHQAAVTPRIPRFLRSFYTSPVFTDENSRVVSRPAAPGIQSSPARAH